VVICTCSVLWIAVDCCGLLWWPCYDSHAGAAGCVCLNHPAHGSMANSTLLTAYVRRYACCMMCMCLLTSVTLICPAGQLGVQDQDLAPAAGADILYGSAGVCPASGEQWLGVVLREVICFLSCKGSDSSRQEVGHLQAAAAWPCFERGDLGPELQRES
jgi:hypothetical protein